jgi:mannose-6-phosphate isomerase-like protein (cupin superfamily)
MWSYKPNFKGANFIAGFSYNLLMKPTRRVVTGHDENGKAVVLTDGAAPNMKQRKNGGNVLTVLWVTGECPVDVSGTADNGNREVRVPPPPSGSIFRIVEFAPQVEGAPPLDHDAMLREMGLDPDTQGYSRHQNTHRTRTIDYAIVLEGEIDMLLDDSQVHMKAGDVMVQQATSHAWVNNSGKPCRIAFILIDAKEPAAWKKPGGRKRH